MDSILHFYNSFARYYVDDIVIFFKIFEKYIEYLNTILDLFGRLDVTLKNTKNVFRLFIYHLTRAATPSSPSLPLLPSSFFSLPPSSLSLLFLPPSLFFLSLFSLPFLFSLPSSSPSLPL